MQEHILLVELFCRCVFSDLRSVKHGGISFEVWINILQHVDRKNKTAFSKFDEAAYIQSPVYWGYTTYCTSPVMNPNFICHQHSFIYYLWRELCSCNKFFLRNHLYQQLCALLFFQLLQRLLDDRRPTVEMIRAEGARIAATADTQDREKIQSQLQSLAERWSDLLDKAGGRSAIFPSREGRWALSLGSHHRAKTLRFVSL